MESANIVIIGGGIIGMSVAAKLSENNDGVYVFERNSRLGQEATSHNSGVIHSGIHYPNGSLKAELCVKGNSMLYDICGKYGIPHKRLGKLTVAIEEEEIGELEKLEKQGAENGVEGLRLMDGEEVKKMEPEVKAVRALLSPTTGIIEPDELLNHFYARTRNNNGTIALGTMVSGIRKTDSGYEVRGSSAGEKFVIQARTVINCGGLNSDRIAEMAGIDIDEQKYRIHFCKGDYFRISGKAPVKRLVYPVPKGVGLGIHLTPDLAGSVKLGPNAYYVDDIDYRVESSEIEFRKDVMRYLPRIKEMEIHEDSSGVRAKLQGPNDPFRDFVIRDEAELGLPGFVNLIGIDSPGLTASPAIAEFVSEIYENEIKS
jgi:L-2-hydroxyglutarate oxidase LhgO